MATKQPFKFETTIIDPILNCIKEHQVYLTQPENLPQLAKLGYMYNTLWYAGRTCWGYNGILQTNKVESDNYGDCEDNPKYKIEMCEPETEEIENLIYDAWGMHVSDGPEGSPTFDEFKQLILVGKEMTDFDKKLRKPNKTFDEWVDVLTNPQYQYHSIYPNRRAVANHLLCVIGNGYGWNAEGFIIREAGGADQDQDVYGFWENAQFNPAIQAVVDKILAIPELAATLTANYERRQAWFQQEKAKKRKSYQLFYDILQANGLYQESEGDLDSDDLFERMDTFNEQKDGRMKKVKEYSPYYPISSYSKLNLICDPQARIAAGVSPIHPSYHQVAQEICNEIIAHAEQENKAHHGENNVKYAKKYLGLI